MKFFFTTALFFFFCTTLMAKPQHGEGLKSSAPETVTSTPKTSSFTEAEKEKEKKEKEEKEKKEKEEKKKKEEEEKKKKKKKEDENPWFVGTLLAIFGENIPPGRLLFETYVFESRLYGVYDANSRLIKDRNTHLYSAVVQLETGITKKVDVALFLTEIYTVTSLGTSTNFGDIQLTLGFQVSSDKKGSWIPDIRVVPGIYLPTGKFENLNPALRFTDATGTGAYRPNISLVIQKKFYNIPKHPYLLNFNFTLIQHTKVFVQGANFFGGDPNTLGIVSPGERFIFNLSFEYKINRNWGWGLDVHYDYQNSSSFHNKGGSSTFRGDPSFYQFSLAPEIEYDLSSSVAFEFGLWYTLAGRNNFAFFTGFFFFSYEF